MRCCVGTVPGKMFFPAGSGAFHNIHLGMPYVWMGSLSFCVFWSPPLLVLVRGPLGWCSDTGHCQTLCIIDLEMPVCSYHTVHYLCLHLLELSIPGGSNLCKRGSFFLLRAGNRFVKWPQVPEIYLHLSATLPPSEVSWSSSRPFQGETVEWAQASLYRACGSSTWGLYREIPSKGFTLLTPPLWAAPPSFNGIVFSRCMQYLEGLIQSVSHWGWFPQVCRRRADTPPSWCSMVDFTGELVFAFPQCSNEAQNSPFWLPDRPFPGRTV